MFIAKKGIIRNMIFLYSCSQRKKMLVFTTEENTCICNKNAITIWLNIPHVGDRKHLHLQ